MSLWSLIVIVAALVLVVLYIRLIVASKKEDRALLRCGSCQHWVRHNPKGVMGTCFCRGFNHGVDKPENGYCDRACPRDTKE